MDDAPDLTGPPGRPTRGAPRMAGLGQPTPGEEGDAGAGRDGGRSGRGVDRGDGVSRFVRFDPVTGEASWETARADGFLDPPALDPSAGEHGVVVATEGTTGAFPGVVGLDLSTGAQLWRFGLRQVARGAPSIA